MTHVEVELRLPSSTQYAYANIKFVADSRAELDAMLDPENIADLANRIGAAESTANAVFTMAEGGIVASVQTTPPPAAPPVQSAPTPPWKQTPTASTSADQGKPWLKAQAGAPMQAGNTAPADDNTLRVEFDYMDGDKFNEFRAFTGAFYSQHKNSFSKPKGEQLYRFYRKPSPETLAELKAGLEYFGGTIVSE